MVGQKDRQTRDEKLENLIMDHSMIFMGMFEEAFTNIADTMTAVLASSSAMIAEALGSSEPGSADAGKKVKDQITPEVRNQIVQVFSGIRKEMASQWPKNANLFKQYISSPDFDEGIEIVEKYRFRAAETHGETERSSPCIIRFPIER